MSEFVRFRILALFVILGSLLLFGSLGYMLLEGWNFADGFFMTVITLSTVGYGETHELSPHGRWFTTILIMFCIVSLTMLTATITSYLVEADLGGTFIQRKMLKMIAKLKDHTIVCGTTQMAEVIIEQLVRKRKDVVVIDDDEQRLEDIRRRFRRVNVVKGVPTDELNLAKGNILEAAHVVAALPSEVDNLLVSITCRDIDETINVYAKSNDSTIGNRMRKAGVKEVISPSELCGAHVSSLIMSTAQDANRTARETITT